ncbi:MAG TPA: permease-like cell division protein FtsX [Actinomycetota bacterium]|nr:permease-like cell division protein FtsX [Actinomycetota bacterium]
MRRFRYFFRETFTALRRNALVAFAAISTMFISLFLLGGSLLVQKQVELLVGEWGSKVEVSVFLREDASGDEIQALTREIEGLPEVQQVFFESKQQAYQRFQRLFRDSPALVENVDPESMPQSFRVKLVDPEQFSVIRARLAGQPAIDEIRDEQRVLKRLFAVTAVLRTGVMGVAFIMLIAAAGLIGNTVRMAVFARRKEIAIMKLVGATNWFIRVPFLIEGAVGGLLGAGLAVLGLFAMKMLFIDPLRGNISFTPWVGTGAVLETVPWLVGVGILMAVIASLFAMRRFLEV